MSGCTQAGGCGLVAVTLYRDGAALCLTHAHARGPVGLLAPRQLPPLPRGAPAERRLCILDGNVHFRQGLCEVCFALVEARAMRPLTEQERTALLAVGWAPRKLPPLQCRRPTCEKAAFVDGLCRKHFREEMAAQQALAQELRQPLREAPPPPRRPAPAASPAPAPPAEPPGRCRLPGCSALAQPLSLETTHDLCRPHLTAALMGRIARRNDQPITDKQRSCMAVLSAWERRQGRAAPTPTPTPARLLSCPGHPDRAARDGSGVCKSCAGNLSTLHRQRAPLPLRGTAIRLALEGASPTWLARFPHLLHLRALLEVEEVGATDNDCDDAVDLGGDGYGDDTDEDDLATATTMIWLMPEEGVFDG